MSIDWSYPEPRKGLIGEWDKFIGPGATRAELWLELGSALVAGVALVAYALVQDLGWSGWQLLVAGLLALDLMGGVVTNATTAAKRWYHREGQGLPQHIGFVAVHVVHLFLVAWLFRGMDWTFLLVMYGYLLVASFVILRVPLYLQRPVALLWLCGVVAINHYVFAPVAGLEWFLPVFFLKLLVSHLLREAPYRSASRE